eukprot:4716217-Pyramimonas_sp.AAC.1
MFFSFSVTRPFLNWKESYISMFNHSLNLFCNASWRTPVVRPELREHHVVPRSRKGLRPHDPPGIPGHSHELPLHVQTVRRQKDLIPPPVSHVHRQPLDLMERGGAATLVSFQWI